MDSGPTDPKVGAQLARLLAQVRPDEFALRARVAPQLDASMLDRIAAADYGVDVDRYRCALTELLTAPWWLDALEWDPREVLELTRWSEPEKSPDPGAAGRRGHLMRIFACLVLVRVETRGGGPSDSLAPLVASALELGPPVLDDALRYLAWCRLHEPGDWRLEPAERPFLTFGLLLLATVTRAEPDLLGGLAHVLLEELETALVDEGLWWQVHGGAPPLLGLRPYGIRRRMWRDLAGRCLVDHAPDHEVGVRLAMLGDAVRGRTEMSISDLRPHFADWST